MQAKFKSYLKTMSKSVIFKNAEGVFLKKLVWTEKKKPRCVGAFPSIYQAFRKKWNGVNAHLHFSVLQHDDDHVDVHARLEPCEVGLCQARFPNVQPQYRQPHYQRDWSMHGIPT